MIGAVLRVSWLVFSRDRYALVLSFLVPIAFFSILALVFQGVGGETLPAVRVVVIDDDRTLASGRLLTALTQEPGLAVESRTADAGTASEVATLLVRRGDAPVAVVVPTGFGERLAHFPLATLTVELFSDGAADPVAHHVVGGLVQRAVVLASPDELVRAMARWVEEESGPLAPAQRELVEEIAKSVAGSDPASARAPSPFQVVVTDVRSEGGRRSRSVISYYAAAIGVMFLLFTMSTAMRGLVQEAESGTLERLLSTDLTMGPLLFARWSFATVVGCVQLAVMFLWGWAIFGLDLFAPGHLAGTVVMTLVSAAAAASFGLVLGTLCRSAAQLQGLSTVVILLMSALGGSMVPRYLMPEAMQRVGLLTFNAWAVQGYEKVLWRDAPVAALWPEVSLLGALTLVGLLVARRLARRWEST
ncbi:MAG: ABC transporter permease [Candidatus Binatia bacterium]